MSESMVGCRKCVVTEGNVSNKEDGSTNSQFLLVAVADFEDIGIRGDFRCLVKGCGGTHFVMLGVV